MKKYEQQISQVKSEIEKHKDALNSLKLNQEFLLDLSEPSFLRDRETKRTEKILNLKRDWIARHRKDPELDYEIIFKDDEDIHDGVKCEFSFLATFNLDQRLKKPSREFRAVHADIQDHEWEHRFEQLMELRLIDVPLGFYKDHLYFKDPEDLKAIFAKLEEENLSFIHQQ